jgi:ribosomal protein L15
MDLSNLKPAKGSTKNRKRIARGTGSGHGGTSTRGHKGAVHAAVTAVKSGSKVVRCPCNAVFLNSVLKILTV